MTPRIHTSEPKHRAQLSQWQRERMGRVHAMNAAYAATGWRQGIATCTVVVAVILIIGAFA